MRRATLNWAAVWTLIGMLSTGSIATANVRLPNIFSDHLVLQQQQKNKVWGKADAGEVVTVSIGPMHSQVHTVTTDAQGDWSVMLNPLPVGGPYQLTVKGNNEIKLNDILVGEVWICSGQSNMQWWVRLSNDPDLEALAANHHPQIRMINFPNIGTQEPIWSHDAHKWQVCSSTTVSDFSAVGYFFARQLQETLGVPVGMINNAWGGSAAEAWIRRDAIAADPQFQPLLDRWGNMEKRFAELKAKEKDQKITEDEKKELGGLGGGMGGNHRPANIYNGVLNSHIGYGIKGAIWYQGESNADRAYQYRELFPLMIKNWRDDWKQGDFPFYWVQLADFLDEQPEPGESNWAELREAQTMAMSKVPNSGQAVIIDIGEGKDIHPKNKVDVARRLARWALAKDYGVTGLAFHSPQYRSMAKQGNKIVLTFDYVDGGWRPYDTNTLKGFSIAGEDKKFYWATAKINPQGLIEVESEKVPNPVSVRYGWAHNPVVNVFSAAGLPLTPFRTDDWPGVTINNK